MPTRVIAFILSFLSFFAFWNPNAQPNNIPETRSYVGEAPDKYGIWPTEDFIEGSAPLLWGRRFGISLRGQGLLHRRASEREPAGAAQGQAGV